MTPTDSPQIVALTFVREVSRELVVEIIRTERYQRRDDLSLIVEAREYIKSRLPVHDRAMAVAILLRRDAVRVDFQQHR